MLHTNLGESNNHLTFAGLDTVSLAEKYGTPLMLLDEQMIRTNIKAYKHAMIKYLGEGSFPCYASKALSFKEIYRIVKSEDIGIDVVSIGEMYTAISAGCTLERMFFHGNNKTDEEIAYAIEHNIGYIVVDNPDELRAINDYCIRNNTTQKVLLRITPGIDPHTNEKINTGKINSKFGVPIETGQAEIFVDEAMNMKTVEVCGYHCHVGSQCFDSTPFVDAAEIMLKFIADINIRYGVTTKYLNLGGGYGVRYLESDPQLNVEDNIKYIGKKVKTICKEYGITQPNIIIEPGRSIVAEAGITIYTCGSVKVIKDYKTFVSVDGGMTDNPRYPLYEAPYTVLNASKVNTKPTLKATVVGRCCESGDVIQRGVNIAPTVRGDKIAVLVTGAYNYSMASNYNRVARPPVVMVNNKIDRVVVKRETLDDLIANDI